MVDYLTGSGYAVAFLIILINRYGGFQVVIWRIRKVQYFIDYIRGPDKRYRKRMETMDKILKNPARWPYGQGEYLLPEAEAAISEHGAPMYFHAWDDARCIPQYMDTIMDEETGEYKTVFRPKVPPEIIRAGFRSKIAVEMHPPPREESNKLAWYIVPMIFLVLLAVLATAYYSHDVACAVRAHSC